MYSLLCRDIQPWRVQWRGAGQAGRTLEEQVSSAAQRRRDTSKQSDGDGWFLAERTRQPTHFKWIFIQLPPSWYFVMFQPTLNSLLLPSTEPLLTLNLWIKWSQLEVVVDVWFCGNNKKWPTQNQCSDDNFLTWTWGKGYSVNLHSNIQNCFIWQV